MELNWRFNLDTWREIGKRGNFSDLELREEVTKASNSQLRAYVYGVLERSEEEEQEQMLLLLTPEQQKIASLFITKIHDDYGKILHASK
jgi:Spy/CpxP family protein refolding chaperone